MTGYVVLSLSLIFFLLISLMSLAMWYMLKSLNSAKDMQISNLSLMLNDERKQKIELLNRLMSEDLKTFRTLNSTNSSVTPFSDYVPQTDEAEVQRLHGFFNEHGISAAGIGEGNYDDAELAGIRDVLGTAP